MFWIVIMKIVKHYIQHEIYIPAFLWKILNHFIFTVLLGRHYYGNSSYKPLYADHFSKISFIFILPLLFSVKNFYQKPDFANYKHENDKLEINSRKTTFVN